MSPRLHTRIAAALLAAVYLALPGGLAGVRVCVHHDAAAATGAAEAAPSHHDHGAAADPSGSSEESHGGCSCLDTCAAGSAPALDAPSVVAPFGAYGEALTFEAADTGSPRATRPPHFLPFAQGPPSIPA